MRGRLERMRVKRCGMARTVSAGLVGGATNGVQAKGVVGLPAAMVIVVALGRVLRIEGVDSAMGWVYIFQRTIRVQE
jgi:hypothetical protein